MNSEELTAWIGRRARELGFSGVGIAPAVSPPGVARLDEWLAAGYAGEMGWLEDRREAYDHPKSVLEGARSVVMLTLDYRTAEPAAAVPGTGRVSRYAWGTRDYHDVIHERLKVLIADAKQQAPEFAWRGVVDTAPIMEREFAQIAGLGWIGKHTLLLNRQQGSYFFLAALLTDAELTVNLSAATDHCGTCTACLDACPTDAFPSAGVLDASRCISYLTIEHRGSIPRELREGMGEWVFGCDVCQDVCPWNRRVGSTEEPAFWPQEFNNPLDLAELFFLNEEEFRRRYRKTPLWRAKRRGLLRNAAIVLGNRPSAAAAGALARGLEDEEPLVRGAAAWALGEYPAEVAEGLLAARRRVEEDPEVKGEIDGALGNLQNAATVDLSHPGGEE